MSYVREITRRGLGRWEWKVSDPFDRTHVWHGRTRTRREAESEADRLRRQLAAVDAYATWRRPADPEFGWVPVSDRQSA